MIRKSEVRDVSWWKAETPFSLVFDTVKSISDDTSVRRQMDLYHACMYDDSELTGLGNASYNEYEPSTLAFNVVRQAVDTLSAKIAKAQPLPTPVTSGGTWQEKRRAQKFGKAIQGQFDVSGVWRTSPTIARDCGLFGTGLTHNYRVGKTIYHERILPWEVRINRREAMYGKPRNMYTRRWVDREVLVERFPELEPEIRAAGDKSDIEDYDPGYEDKSDLVLVIEAWHLPSRILEDDDKKPHDGKHVICIDNATLLTEEYRKQYFPFSVLRMSDPVVGWFGTGLAKQLTGLQYTINDLASVIQEAFALSGGYIFVEAGSKVDTDKLTNGRGAILTYTGQIPQWSSPSPIDPDHWNFLQALIPKAFEMTGVSQLSAQSQKPAGIESAIALNTFNDIETERFALFAKQYEEYHIDVAWQLFDLMEEIEKEYGGDFKIRTTTRDRGQRMLREIEYSQVRVDRNTFVLQVFPTSLLSKKPAARLEEIQTFINAGWITPEDGRMLLDFPDLERFNNLQTAASRIIDEVLEKMLDAEDPEDPNVYTYPEPEFNLKLCVAKGLQTYLDAKLDGCPEENLSLVLQFIQDAKDLMGNGNAAIPPGAPVPGDPNAPPPVPPPPGGMPMDPNTVATPQAIPPDAGAAPVDPNMPPPEGAPAPVAA